ncbi:hypothetical protein MJH12_09670 [bacterium]|nr:hypothetical protein [bacterium]
MSIQLKSKQYFIQLESGQTVYIDQSTSHPVSFSCDKKLKVHLLNQAFLQQLENLSVLEVFSSLQSSDEELKNFLVNSPFVPILKSKYSSLYNTEKIQIIASLLKLSKIDIIHVKYPELSFGGPELHSLFLSLTQLASTLIWEGKVLANLCGFDLSLNSLGVLFDQALPSSPVEAQKYFGEETYFLHGSFVSTEDDFLLNFGKLSVSLSNEDKLLFLGLMNHSAIFSFIPSQFTFSNKDKKGTIKCEFLKQFKRGIHHYAHLNFKGIPLLIKSDKKFPTPFSYVNPNLSQSLIFHKEKAQLLFPLSDKA